MSSKGRGGKKLFKVKRDGARTDRTFSSMNEDSSSGMVHSQASTDTNRFREQRKQQDSSSEQESDNELSGDEEEDPQENLKKADKVPNNQPKKNIKLSQLNQVAAATESTTDSGLNRREKEELQKQKAKEAYFKATMDGKTDQAKADMARLSLIRQQREEAAQRRLDETANKVGNQKSESINAGKSLSSKTMGKK